MTWKRFVAVVGVLLVILLGLLAGLARGYGTDLGGVLDVWGRVIGSVVLWVLVAAAGLLIMVAGALLLRRRRSQTRPPTRGSASVAAQPAAAAVTVPPIVIVAQPTPVDHIPGPRDFVPPTAPRASENGHAMLPPD